MNDEIKEILELFGSTDENIMFGDIVELNSKQSHLLLDYITNLQKEVRINNDLIPYLKNKEKSLKKQITNLQEENERLKMDIRYWEDKWQYTKFSDKDYKSRCEVAIEYINAGKTFDDIDVGKIVNKIQNNLLNILEGSDKE